MTQRPIENVKQSGSPDCFAFGSNWKHYLSSLQDANIDEAIRDLQRAIDEADLSSKTFLDAGSGSGLHSLAAYRLHARVTSFDQDHESIACAEYLRTRYAAASERWIIETGSLLNRAFCENLGQFDIVYCWGVAHHTGDMWKALDHVFGFVAPRGKVIVAIYNDQGFRSRIWRSIKQMHHRSPRPLKTLIVIAVGLQLFVQRLVMTSLASCLRLLRCDQPWLPFQNWLNESRGRGMRWWTDLVDWVGGWPFEVAKPDEVFDFAKSRGFQLERLTTTPGHGCNEFLFVRS